LLSVSSLARLKKVDSTINLISYLPTNFSLKIYGDGVERSNLQEITHDLNIERRVEFLGFQESPFSLDKEKAKILVINSKTEAMPTIILEAIEAGVPVILSYYKGAEYWEGLNTVNLVDKVSKNDILSFKSKFQKLTKEEYKQIFFEDINTLTDRHSYKNFTQILEQI